MPVIFYPHDEDIGSSTLQEKLTVLQEAAERYKAAVLDARNVADTTDDTHVLTPKGIKIAFNWQEIAKALREIRDLPENTPAAKTLKANHLTKLAEIYEVLRAAKMPKLEAVRVVLVNEASQLRAGGSTHVI